MDNLIIVCEKIMMQNAKKSHIDFSKYHKITIFAVFPKQSLKITIQHYRNETERWIQR